MIRLLLLTLIALHLGNAHALTRAYYVGRDQISLWRIFEEDLLNPEKMADPFDPSSPPRVEAPIPTQLKQPPFKSPHFSPGDSLFDFKIFKERLKINKGKSNHIIYNKTTGRFVIQGESKAHHFFKFLAIRTSEDCPILVELNFEIQEEGTRIFATSGKGRPGLKTNLKASEGPSSWSLEWEPQTYSEYNMVDLQLSIKGKIGNQNLRLQTGLILLNDKRKTIAIGKTTKDQKSLSLTITPHVLLNGEVRISDLVLDETGQTLDKKDRLNLHHDLFNKELADPQSGKVLKAFRVPPTFLHFIKNASNYDPDLDPFAAAEPPKTSSEYQYVESPDPRILALPYDRFIDAKKLLMQNGVSFQPSDFAVLNLETDTLFCQTNRSGLMLIEGIVLPVGSWGTERLISWEIQQVKSQKKLSSAGLRESNFQLLSQVSTVVLPGQTSTLTLDTHHLEIEAQIDSNDRLIESNLDFQIDNEHEPSLHYKAALIHENGIPQILQSTFQNGLWHSLILTGKIESP